MSKPIPFEFDDEVKWILGGDRRMSKPMPFEFDDEVKWILGSPNFQCHPIAQRLRALGRAIPTKAEDEQAAVIYWMLGLYLEHGELWRRVGRAILAPPTEAAEQQGGAT